MRRKILSSLGILLLLLASQLGAQTGKVPSETKTETPPTQQFDIKIKIINDLPPPLHHRFSMMNFFYNIFHKPAAQKTTSVAEQHVTVTLDSQSMIKMQASQELILLGVTPRYKDGTLVTLIISGKIWTRVHHPGDDDDATNKSKNTKRDDDDAGRCDRSCHDKNTDDWLKKDNQFRYKSFSYTADTALNQLVTVYPLGRSDNINNLRIELTLTELSPSTGK